MNKDNTQITKGDEVTSPFSRDKLNEIFKISPKNPDRTSSRESSNLEFKESFGWNSLAKYLKTAAGFSNARGGYIVYGIGRKPHKLIGLKGKSLQLFEEIDPAKLSGHLSDHFAPEIKWEMHEHEIEGKAFGLIYVFECEDKPVVCKKEAESILKEGDIYYRYRGRSERIKYSELKTILEQKRENEQRLWMKHVSQISRIGVRDVGIFDFHTGLVTGTKNSFLIDESLLSQLSVIREGALIDEKGKPVFKLTGSLEAVTGLIGSGVGKKIVKTKGIRVGDIVLAFLKEEKVLEPVEYIRQICFESTAFLPLYYFMKLAKLDAENAKNIIKDVISRSQAKTKLLTRLESGTTQNLQPPKGDIPSSKKKKKYMEALKKKTVNQNISGKDLEYCLQAMRSLSYEEVIAKSKYLREILRLWFNKYYSTANSSLADNLRRTFCWIDEVLYMKEAK